MRLLLDTHVLIWWVEGNERLPASVRAAISDVGDDVHVSAVTTAEIAIERALGTMSGPSASVVVDEPRVAELALASAHAAVFEDLPLHHRDPFDRMLVAQALVEGLVLVTVDEAVRRYDVPVFPPR